MPQVGVRVAVRVVVLGETRSENVAVAGSQTPTSPTPSPFQSPATGRPEAVPEPTVRVETAPDLLAVRSVKVRVLAE